MAGKPGVYITTDNFLHDARNSAEDNGMSTLRIVAVPADKYYRARITAKEVLPVAEAALGQIIGSLTRPATATESNPKPVVKKSEEAPIKVSAASISAALGKVNDLFLERRWADGLPIIPPTEEAVKLMLSGTNRSPDEVIGIVQPKNGVATVKKIAINSVMAGAKPEYLPVILAAMEGFTDSNFDLTHLQASTGSFIPAVIVSGPIAKELNFNSGIGLLGHGWRANSTVGRALRLCLLNLGQTWPAVNDMGLTGRVSSYTFYTFATNEDSPLEPDYTENGLGKDDSVVTVSTVGGQFPTLGGGAVALSTAQNVLDRIVSNIVAPGLYVATMKYVIVFNPDCAKELAQMGYTRKSLQEWLYEKSRTPFSRLAPENARAISSTLDNGRWKPGRADIFRVALKSGGNVPAVQSPEDIHIYVAGGSPGYTLMMSYGGLNWGHSVKKVRGATLTKAGRN
jgi:hypothetical protein